MSPPTEEVIAPAVEEAPPVGPASPEVPVALDPGAPAAEPPTPQEPPGEEESGTEQGEEAGEEQPPEPSFWERQDRLIAENPEFRAEAEKHGWVSPELRARLQEPTEDRAEWQAAQDRQATVRKAGETAFGYSGQNVQQALKGWADGLAGNVRDAARDLIEHPDNSPDLLNVETMTGGLGQYIQDAAYAWAEYAHQSAADSVLTALEGHKAHRHLTADDKTALKEAAGKPAPERLAAAAKLYLDAALRAANPEFKATAEEEIKKKIALDKEVAQLNSELGDNGRRVAAGTSVSGPHITNIDEAEEAYTANPPTITHKQYGEYRKKFLGAEARS